MRDECWETALGTGWWNQQRTLLLPAEVCQRQRIIEESTTPKVVTTFQGASFVLPVSDKLAGLICETRVHKTGAGDRSARSAYGTGAVG